MSTRKKSRKVSKNYKKDLSKTTLHIIVYALELILLFFILSLLITDMYGFTDSKPVVETINSTVKKIPDDVKSEMQIKTGGKLRVPILMYHYVENITDTNDTFRMNMNIEPVTFEQQIQTLKNAGYTFITTVDLANVFDGLMGLPEKPILITFDDGHWDLYTDVLPILKKHNVKITAYIIPGFVGGSDFLTLQQLQELNNSGLVEIGAHTMHHVSLSDITNDEVLYEINESKNKLEKELGISVTSIAYPNGAFNSHVANVVSQSRFRTAVSTIPGIEHSEESRYFLYRLRPGRRVGDELLVWLDQDSFQAF